MSCRPAALSSSAMSSDERPAGTPGFQQPQAAGRPGRQGRTGRDRRGRGLRGRLAPSALPISNSRSALFDSLVLNAVDHLRPRAGERLDRIEFAVDDVPAIDSDGSEYDSDVLDDDGVPLSRLFREGLGEISRPVIVIYRRPLESRSIRVDDLADLVHEVVVEQVARMFGTTADEIDPPLD
jgi:predicted Zn-dependent protease with MMP-like domain